MKNWLQKIIVIFVALITFGIISPSHEIWELLDQEQADNSKSEHADHSLADNSNAKQDGNNSDVVNEQHIDDIFIAAKEQSYLKFGTKIAPVISDEFDLNILPKFEKVIESTLEKTNYKSLNYIKVTEQPSGNYSEKIFNISDGTFGKGLVRFHVRTEKRPLEGYYYNFHYHTYEDRFVAHHDVGDIYWSKNTPPKWLS